MIKVINHMAQAKLQAAKVEKSFKIIKRIGFNLETSNEFSKLKCTSEIQRGQKMWVLVSWTPFYMHRFEVGLSFLSRFRNEGE